MTEQNKPAATKTAKNLDQLSAVGRIVYEKDKDRFLTVMLLAPAYREAVLTLYAFNYEVAKTASAVSEATLGQIRLQWWREAVEECFNGQPRRHEITRPLATVMEKTALSTNLIDQLIDARERDLSDESVQTLAQLMTYADQTGGGILKLAVQACDCRDKTVLQVAGKIGTAWALIGLMRALPFHLRAKQQWMPEELIKRHAIDGRAMRDLNESDELNKAVAEIGGITRDLIAEARQETTLIPKHIRPLFHLATLAESYCKQLERAGWNPYDPSMAQPKGSRMFSILWKNLRNKF